MNPAAGSSRREAGTGSPDWDWFPGLGAVRDTLSPNRSQP
jgi:hypothetical protein